jgi:SAM-dependent methyltransferase
MNYVLCRDCDMLYTNPRATEESLSSIYSSWEFFEGKEDNLNYYSFLAGADYLSPSTMRRLEHIQALSPGKDLLEVACATSFFLNQAKLADFNVQGIEFSRPMAECAQDRWNVPVIPGSIEHVDLEEASLDVIASWGLFTILRDPAAVLREFYQALRTGGILALNTYYHDGLWARLWGSNWYILVVNTSQLFTRATLRRILEENGFEIVRVRRDQPYASVKYLAFQLLSHLPGSVRNSVFDLLDFLNRFVVRVPAPDNYEYLCVER